MPKQVVPIEGISQAGVIKDSPAVGLAPNAFSDARNVRFDDQAIRKMKGEVEILTGTLTWTNIQHIRYWENPNRDAYLVIDRESTHDRAYIVTLNTDGTANKGLHRFQTTNRTGDWQSTVFNGGYTIIINNGLETPQYLSDSISSTGVITTANFANLPGWGSYTVASTDSQTGVAVANPVVTAGIVTAFGNLLVAADLREVTSGGATVRDLAGVIRSSDVAGLGNIPQSWNPFATGANTADELLLADTGRITAVNQMQGNLFVFTTDSIHQVQVSGAGLSTIPVTHQYGALAQDSVFEFDGQLIIVGSNDIYTFGGHPGSIQSMAEGRVRRYFFDNLTPLTPENMFIQRDQLYDEIWICYPTLLSADGTCDEALIWNYKNNTWTIRDLPGITSATAGPIPGGGAATASVTLSGLSSGTDAKLNNGRAEVQTMTIDGSIRAPHNGITQQQSFQIPSTLAYVAEGREIIELTVSGDAGPNTVAAVQTVTGDSNLASFTYSDSVLNGGALLTLTDNVGTYDISASVLSGLSGSTSFSSFITAAATYINGDNLTGFDWSASASGNVLTLTSDVVGARTFTAASLTYYTGSSTSISGSNSSTDDTNNLRLVRADASSVTNAIAAPALSSNTITLQSGNYYNFSVRAHSGTGSGGVRLFTGYTGSNARGSLDLNIIATPDVSAPNLNMSFDSGSTPGGNANGIVASGFTTFPRFNNPAPSDESNGSNNGTLSSARTITYGGGTSRGDRSGSDPAATAYLDRVSVTAVISGYVTETTVITLSATVTGGFCVQGAVTDFSNGTISIVNSNLGGSQSIPSYNWKLTNNRTDADNYLATTVSSYIATVGSETLTFGTVTAGNNKTLNTFDASTTATYTATVNGTTSQSFNQGISDSGTTIGDVIEFTRTTGTQIDAIDASGTASATHGGIAVTVTSHGGSGLLEGRNANGHVGSICGITPTTNRANTSGSVTIPAGSRYCYGGAGAAHTTPSNGNFNTYFYTSGGTSISWQVGGGGQDANGASLVIRWANTYTITFENTNSYDVTLTADSTGGARTIAAGTTVTVQSAGVNASSNSWVLKADAVSQYNWEAKRINDGVNDTAIVITHAAGSDITDITLTDTNQTIVSNATIPTNFQGSYTVVDGTATAQTAPTRATSTAGVGHYGISAADSPSIRMHITHGLNDQAADWFDYTIDTFDGDDDTPEEFRDKIYDFLIGQTEFTTVDPNDNNATFPSGALYFLEKIGTVNTIVSGDDTYRLRMTRGTAGNIEDMNLLSITYDTHYNAQIYAETVFGGDVSDSTEVTVQGQSGSTPAVVRMSHPTAGNTDVIVGGTHTATTFAQTLALSLARNPYFAATSTGRSIIAGQAEASESTEALIALSVLEDDDDLLTELTPGNFTQTRAAVDPETQNSVMTISLPGNANGFDNDPRTFDVALTGASGVTLSATDIATLVRAATAPTGWTIGGTGANVTFTSTNNYPYNRSDSTPLRGQGTGTVNSILWNWSVTDPNGNLIPETGGISTTGDAVETTSGIPIVYGHPTVIRITFSRDEESVFYDFVYGGSYTSGALAADTAFEYAPYTANTNASNTRVTVDNIGANLATSINGISNRITANYNATTNILTVEPNQYGAQAFFVTAAAIENAGTFAPSSLAAAVSSSEVADVAFPSNGLVIEDSFDAERPWPKNTFNKSKNYLTMVANDKVLAADVGFDFDGTNIKSYVERQRMHLQPTKDVEMVSAVYMDVEYDGDVMVNEDFKVRIGIANNATVDINLEAASDTVTEYDFVINNTDTDIDPDYKVDVRKTGRLMAFRVENEGNQDYVIASVGLELGKGGER